MNRRVVALALVLLCLAVLAALLAADLLGVRSSLRRGDRAFASDPASASWQLDSLLPFDPARRILAVDGELAFRRAAQSFEAVSAAGAGYDNGLSEAASRGEAEADLGDVSRSGPGARVSAADNMLGILAYADSKQTGPTEPAPIEQSVGNFQAAIRADPSNDVAKYNLELLLRELAAHGARHGSNGSSGGPAHGHKGASGGNQGRGY